MLRRYPRSFCLLLVLSTLSLFVVSSGTFAASGGKKLQVMTHEHVPGELLVKFRPGVSESEARGLLREYGGNGYESARFKAPKRVSHAAIGRWWHVKLPKGKQAKQVIERLSKNSKVEAAELNYMVRAIQTPNDPRYAELWGLNNVGQTGGAHDADIDAPEAWDSTTGSSGVLVAVIDTGVDYTHPDLAANIWTNPGEIPGNGMDDDGNGYVDDVYGYDFYNNDANPFDDHGHGTHCAGTIAAVGNNGIGVVGVSWRARIMSVKFLDATGSGYTSGAISAVLYATDAGARILSNSWGGGGFSQALHDAIVAARDANALFVAAAGNSNSDNDSFPNYPSNHEVDNVLAVAATDHADALAYFSSYGANSVDLGAPGVDILSTVPTSGDYCCSSASGYALLSGTSMATPHVSGAAALLLAQDGTRSALGIKELLMGTTDPVTSLSGITVTGGRLNVNSALTCSGQLRVSPSLPGQNFLAYLNEPAALRALVHTCGTPAVAQVSVSFSNGSPTIALYDDGAHGDGAANDGVYGGTWTPTTPGTVALTFTATNAALGTDTRSVSGIVRQRIDYDLATEPFSWIDITNGTSYSLLDDSSVTIPIGFDFSFYGAQHTDVTVSSNGFLTFTGDNGSSFYNVAIPDMGAPNNFIAPFWDDLDPSKGGAIYSRLDGVAPNRQLVVSWIGVPHYVGGGVVSFQAILREGSNKIVFQYQDVVFGDLSFDYGRSATVGLENADGRGGRQYSYDQAVLSDGLALGFTPVARTNTTPVANPGGPYEGYRNVPLMLDGSASYDPQADALSYQWDFGDGSTGTGMRPFHTYTNKGTYTVTLTVNDGLLNSAPATTTVAVPNHVPVANPGSAQSGWMVSQFWFSGWRSSDPDGDALAYRWNMGDGTVLIGIDARHTYAAPGVYPVTLIVNDGEVDSAPATTTATVDNRLPIVNAGRDFTISRSVRTVNPEGSAYDPDGYPLQTILWVQLSGPTATITNANTFKPTITIPKGLKAPTQMVFELRVTDYHGGTWQDQMRIYVTE